MYILVKNNKIVFSADDTLELRAIILFKENVKAIKKGDTWHITSRQGVIGCVDTKMKRYNDKEEVLQDFLDNYHYDVGILAKKLGYRVYSEI